jgi:ArsR family transcriptional regulator
VCELTDALDAAQSRLSFHLKVLKDAGLIADRREGRWMYYALNQDALAEVTELVEALASAPTPAERKNGCC